MKKQIFWVFITLILPLSDLGSVFSQAAERTPPTTPNSGQPTVTAAMLLTREPLIKGVDYDIPVNADEIAKCTVSSTSEGYVVKDGSGKTLRTFFSRTGGGIQAGYYKNGIEVFRQFNDPRDAKKPNEFRWFNSAGSRWGFSNGTSGVSRWKMVSAEELSAEVISALASKNVSQFMSLAPSEEEIQALGLSKEMEAKVRQKTALMQASFAETATKIALSPNARWIQFSGGKPGAVPSENDSQNVVAYENALVILQDGEGDNPIKQIQLGTIVKISDNNWRLIGVPKEEVLGAAQVLDEYLFFPSGLLADSMPGNLPATDPLSSEIMQINEEIDAKQIEIQKVPVDQRGALYDEILALMLKCATKQTTLEQAENWIRRAADAVDMGARANEYPDGPKKLEALFNKVKEQFPTNEAASYVKYRQIMSDYYIQLHSRSRDPSQVNVNWIKSLEEFSNEFEGTEGAIRGMGELASYYEMVQDTNEALKWYKKIEAAAPNTIFGQKATGAIRRITSIGKVVPFTAKTANGAAFNLAQLKGNIIVLYFWSSWFEPESAGLKSVANQDKNVRIVGVNIDARTEDMTQYLQEHPMPFQQIHEAIDGESIPAMYWGVQVPPVIILIDAEGKVVKQDITTAAELAKILNELKK